MKPLDVALASGAALRLTRFITTDTLPEHLVIWRIRKWNADHDGGTTWRNEIENMCDCPWCIGFHIGLGVLAATAVMPARLRPAWRVLLGSLTLNYATGHISSRLDD